MHFDLFLSHFYSPLTLDTRMPHGRNKMTHGSHSRKFTSLFLQLSLTPTEAAVFLSLAHSFEGQKRFYQLVFPVAQLRNYNQELFLKHSFLVFGLSCGPVLLVAHRPFKAWTSCEPSACANKRNLNLNPKSLNIISEARNL